MRSLEWKETAEIIGLFAILATLIFVGMQLQQQEEMLDLELRNSMLSNYVAINEQIIAHPDIWLRGNTGENLDAAESVIYESLLTNFNDYYFHWYESFIELAPESSEQMLSMYAGFLARNPGAYRVWIDREQQIDADRTAVDPKETVTSDWIETLEVRIALIKASQSIDES